MEEGLDFQMSPPSSADLLLIVPRRRDLARRALPPDNQAHIKACVCSPPCVLACACGGERRSQIDGADITAAKKLEAAFNTCLYKRVV